MEDEYNTLIELAAKKHGVDPALIRAMMARESSGRPDAVSPKGAAGLLQLMPTTAKMFGVTDPTNPEQNINAGTQYLSQLLNQYGGNIERALAAYNAGPTAVSRYGGVPPFPETKRYVSDITARYRPGFGGSTPRFDNSSLSQSDPGFERTPNPYFRDPGFEVQPGPFRDPGFERNPDPINRWATKTGVSVQDSTPAPLKTPPDNLFSSGFEETPGYSVRGALPAPGPMSTPNPQPAPPPAPPSVAPSAMRPERPDEYSIVTEQRPYQEALLKHRAQMPARESYKPSAGRNILAAILGGLASASSQDIGSGIALGRSVKEGRYRNAMADYGMREAALQQSAEDERRMIDERAKATGSVSDRAIRERGVAVDEQGLPIRRTEAEANMKRARTDERTQAFKEETWPKEYGLESRRTGAMEAQAEASKMHALAAQINASRPDASQRVTVDQLEKAEQMVIDRLYRQKPELVDKYWRRNKNGYWEALGKVENSFWFDRNYTPEERKEYEKLQAEINQQVEELATGTRFYPRGFGSQAPYYLQRQ